MTKASRDKGKRGERELAAELRAYGYNCVRGQQAIGRGKNSLAGQDDVVGLPGIHIECKRVERLDLERALTQSISDAEATPGHPMPTVMHRKNRHEWLVTMRLQDWIDLYGHAQGYGFGIH